MNLSDICELIVDCEHKTAPTQETGYPSIRTPNIGRGRFILDGVNRVSEKTYQLWTRRAIPQPGDLIMAREAPVGNVAMIPKGLRPCLGQRTLLLRPDCTKVESAFLNYFLNGPYVQGLIRAKTNGATVAHLNMRDVRTMELPELPLPPAQRRIASILSAYDELIENSQQRIKILESMARALYREWFVYLRFPGHESVPLVPCILGGIPQGHEVMKFGDLCELRKDQYRDSEHSELPLVDMARMPSRSLAPSNTGTPDELATSRILFERGDTLFGAIRCYLHKVVTVHYSGVTNTSVLVLRPKAEYFRALLAIIASDIDTIRWAEKQSTGTKMPVINWGVFQEMPTPIPSKTLAQSFEEVAGPMLDEIGVLATKIENLRRTRDLLLPRLLSGQIDVETIAA